MQLVQALGAVPWRFGFALRECGQALERVGCQLQGIYSHYESTNRHMPIVPVKYASPSLGSDVFVAPSSLLLGNVTVGSKSSIWYNATVRGAPCSSLCLSYVSLLSGTQPHVEVFPGDRQPVTIGKAVNIQDSAYIGTANEYSPPVEIGNDVSIGHGAVIKGATIGNNCLIGINAVVSEGCKVGELSIVAAGAYVEENTEVPSGEVWAGNPARKLRALKPQEKEYLRNLP
ncbi:gamma carbonic anhydrase 3, partial [Haematococcus lacustris]